MSIPQPSDVAGEVLLDLISVRGAEASAFPQTLLRLDPAGVLLTDLFKCAEKRSIEGKRLLYFVALTLALFESESIPTSWTMVLSNFLVQEGLGDLYKEYKKDYLKKKILNYEDETFGFQIHKKLFVSQFHADKDKPDISRWSQNIDHQRRQDIDEIFKRLFASGQRRIIAKYLDEQELTKTERETFSRVIKKKLLACLDPEVQKVARVLTTSTKRSRRQKKSDSSLHLVRLKDDN